VSKIFNMIALNKCRKLLFLTLLFIIIFSCSEDVVNINTKELIKTELLDVSYGSDLDQVYDIYLPAERSNSMTKTFVLVHGGSWVSGDKSDMNELVDIIKLNFPEYAIVNINYRLAKIGKPPFPMQTEDIQSVLNHLKDNSEDYQINQKYAFIGTSAGAHLSMLYSYKYDENSLVEMVCSIVGPTNFTDTNYINNPEYSDTLVAIQFLTGQSIVLNPSYYENVSPLFALTSAAPPTILFYGGMDALVPTSQGVDLNNRLTALNIEHEFTIYENEGHGWSGENAIDTAQKLVIFINKHF
jgi:acetyl esterase/lipase